MKRALDIFNYIIAVCLFVGAAIVLVVSSVTTIYYDYGSNEDWPHYGKENIPLLIVFLVLVFAVLTLLYKRGVFEKNKLMTGIGLGVITAYCLLLIFGIRPIPVSDSMTLDKIINQFMEGDYSELTIPGRYINTWPFQLGYVGFGQIMYTIFGKSNYIAWDLLQLVSILITIFLIYKLTWEFFEDKVVCGIVAILACGALFFYNYVTYVYGDILSMAPQTIALYAMVLYVKRGQKRYGFLSAIFIAIAILIKTNCEVTLIALLMILIGNALTKWDKENRPQSPSGTKLLLQNAILAAIMLALVFASKAAVDAHYAKLSGLDKIPGGNPVWAHIAMGLQESELEDGWYNGYNYDVFEECGFDTEATAVAAKENIRQTLQTFAKRPLHCVKFFLRKFTTQWADSVCISTHNLELVSRHVENQPKICDWLIVGSGRTIMIWIMNIFMPVCYIGVIIYLFGILKGRKASVPEMLLLILILGGIAFHEFWEGSSRYTMRYYIYYLPFAAYGLKVLLGFICEHIKRKI